MLLVLFCFLTYFLHSLSILTFPSLVLSPESSPPYVYIIPPLSGYVFRNLRILSISKIEPRLYRKSLKSHTGHLYVLRRWLNDLLTATRYHTHHIHVWLLHPRCSNPPNKKSLTHIQKVFHIAKAPECITGWPTNNLYTSIEYLTQDTQSRTSNFFFLVGVFFCVEVRIHQYC